MADGIEATAESFARAESIDSGKPLSITRSIDIPRAIANLRWFADAAVKACQGTQRFDSSHASNEVLRMPVGVVGAISPWKSTALLTDMENRSATGHGQCCGGQAIRVNAQHGINAR